MNKIRAFDAPGNTMTVEAGAILADVRTAAETQGRYFPLFHGGAGSSQIGGNLSTNAGGNNALRYGTARDQVLGLEVVLADGTLWDGLRAGLADASKAISDANKSITEAENNVTTAIAGGDPAAGHSVRGGQHGADRGVAE